MHTKSQTVSKQVNVIPTRKVAGKKLHVLIFTRYKNDIYESKIDYNFVRHYSDKPISLIVLCTYLSFYLVVKKAKVEYIHHF